MQLNKNGKQTKIGSMLEATANTFSGFLVSLFVWEFIVGPTFGVSTSFHDSLSITLIFTVTSILRSYFWRRAFVWYTEENKCLDQIK